MEAKVHGKITDIGTGEGVKKREIAGGVGGVRER